VKRLLKQGAKVALVLSVFSLIMASANVVQAGKEDVPRIVNVCSSPVVVEYTIK